MLFPLPQPLDGTGRQADGPPALAGLRLADLQLPGLGDIHRPKDLQRPGLLIEVLPHEAADLAPAQASGQFGEEEVPPHFILLDCGHESVQLFLVQDLLWTVIGLGDHCAFGGILGDQVCAHRVFHSGVEHGVDTGEHGV